MADNLLATQLRKGMIVKIENNLYRIFDRQHVTPGNLRGFVRVKMRNIKSGSMADAEDADAALTYTVTANTNTGLFSAATIDGAGGTLMLGYASGVSGTAAITKTVHVGAVASSASPTPNSNPAANSTGRRPIRSVTRPPPNDPSAEKIALTR